MKHVWYDAKKGRWVSEPFTYVVSGAALHKPRGRRGLTKPAALAAKGVR